MCISNLKCAFSNLKCALAISNVRLAMSNACLAISNVRLAISNVRVTNSNVFTLHKFDADASWPWPWSWDLVLVYYFSTIWCHLCMTPLVGSPGCPHTPSTTNLRDVPRAARPLRVAVASWSLEESCGVSLTLWDDLYHGNWHWEGDGDADADNVG